MASGVVFSYLLLTDYALLHEAAHANLQSHPRRNYWLGFLTGLLFPIPFSMIRESRTKGTISSTERMPKCLTFIIRTITAS